MFPRLIDFGNYGLPTYGVLAATGLLVGLMINVRLARRDGINPDLAWNMGIVAILAAIAGAKLLFLAGDWRYYLERPRQILTLSTLQTGGVWQGGLIAGLIAAAWYMRKHKMPALRTADAFAPGIALGHAFGRLGCFAAGCCYGKPTDLPWGVTFTHPLANALVGTPLDVPLHPTQIYEFLLEVAIFAVLMWRLKRRRIEGEVMGAYLFLYGFGRYFLEFFRDDPGRGEFFNGAMSGTQILSILLVIAGGAMWMRREHGSATAASE